MPAISPPFSTAERNIAPQNTAPRKIKTLALLSALFIAPATQGHAVEGGIYGAPLGGTDIRQAFLPEKAGIYGAIVDATFASPEFRNQNGGYSSLNPAYLTAEVGAVGLLIVYPWKPLNFTIGSSLQINYQYEAEALTVAPGVHKSGKASGFGDSFSDVFYASHYLGLFGAQPGNKQLKYGLTGAFGLAVELPIGQFNANNFVNIGHSTFITIPNVALTYITGPNLSFGDATEISTRFFFDTNKRDPATGYQSGNLIDLDFAVTERLGQFQAGLAGVYAQQITSDHDKTFAVVQPVGDRYAKTDLGPVIAYDFADRSTFKFKALLPVEHENNFNNRSFVFSYARKLIDFQ